MIDCLSAYVPGSEGTQFYLLTAIATHEPYHNDRFGPPPLVVRRSYDMATVAKICRDVWSIIVQNFISRSHYITEELLVHAGINHQLSLYYCFPDLHCGTRGIGDWRLYMVLSGAEHLLFQSLSQT